MSFSLQDFLKVSEEQEKKRAKERENERVLDKEIRAKKCSADLGKISEMITDGVKKEVSEAIKPIEQQQEEHREESNRQSRGSSDWDFKSSGSSA